MKTLREMITLCEMVPNPEVEKAKAYVLKSYPDAKFVTTSGNGFLTEAAEPNHDLHSGIETGVRNAYKQRNLTKLFYYLQARMRNQGGTLQGMVGFDDFINSWAGQEWFAKYKGQIEELEKHERTNHMANFNKKPWFIEEPKGMADRQRVLTRKPNHLTLKTETMVHESPIDKLLNLISRYAEKSHQLGMHGKKVDRYAQAIDRLESKILQFPTGEERLRHFWIEYNNSFDE